MLFRTPLTILGSLLLLVLSIALHEFAHAWAADRLGDATPRRQGRLTLNPLAHFDPLGFLMLVLMAFGLAPFAWGKPVMVNPYYLKGGRRGFAWVALAGPASNLLQAALWALPLRLQQVGVLDLPRGLLLLCAAGAAYNIALAAFNLLPIPPLDGFNILSGFAPAHWLPTLEPLRQYGGVLLLVLILMGGNVLGRIMGPVMDLFWWLIVGR